MNSPFWLGIVQGREPSIGGFHWQVQLRVPQQKPVAVGTTPFTEGKMVKEYEYPIVHAMRDGRMVMGLNVMYGARLNPSQATQANQLIASRYMGGVDMGMWNGVTNSCRSSAVKAYSYILKTVGAMSPEASTIRHGWLDRATHTIRTQADHGEWGMMAFISFMQNFAFLPSMSGGSVK